VSPAEPSQPTQISPDFDARRFALGGALPLWAARDDARPEPEKRRAVSYAIGLIDAMIAELSAIREQLTGEICRSDEASAARADELISQARESRDGGCVQ
jgi:hypothetical protein